MHDSDFEKLWVDLETEILAGASSVGILGLTATTLRLLDVLSRLGLLSVVKKIHVAKDAGAPKLVVPVVSLEGLLDEQYDVIVVAADQEKEDLLLAALPYITGTPKVIVAGYGHLAFRDKIFEEQQAQMLVPSIANGYPNSLVHLYQCLVNASRLKLDGIVAEFGMFKGGTTMFLARVIECLDQTWPVVGFDTFDGFPPRRTPLDMYAHPDCVFRDVGAVERYVSSHKVDVVRGDIVKTAKQLRNRDVVLSFIDTDNYSSALAALDVVQEQTVVGGAIVFDHFTGVDRFRYTLGERIAGKRLLDDPRYFHLHGTGVFYKQRADV